MFSRHLFKTPANSLPLPVIVPTFQLAHLNLNSLTLRACVLRRTRPFWCDNPCPFPTEAGCCPCASPVGYALALSRIILFPLMLHVGFGKVLQSAASLTPTLLGNAFVDGLPATVRVLASTVPKVEEGDILPHQICQACLDMLNKSYYFKQAAVRSNLILKQQVLDEQEPVKAENHFNDNEILEINVAEITVDDMLSQNLTPDNETLVDRSMDPAEIIRRIRKRRELVKHLKKRTRMKCPKCEKSFQKYDNFEAHMRVHFGKKPDIKCQHCDKAFPTVRNLHSHIRTHTGVRKYQCLTCGKNFAYLNVLKNHEMIHAGIKKHVCHICDARFVQSYNLKTHLETHSNQKNYICGQCGKKFAQQGNLKTHLIRHTGIKNIACQVCDMRFYIKGDLFKHMRSHSSEKPYSCPYCDKKFKSQSFKVQHMRTHTGERPYGCDICPKRFMSRKDLRNHRMIHTGEKPHKCVLCDQAFIQKCALNRHMKGHMQKDAENADKPQNILLRARLQGTVAEYSQWNTDV